MLLGCFTASVVEETISIKGMIKSEGIYSKTFHPAENGINDEGLESFSHLQWYTQSDVRTIEKEKINISFFKTG